MDELEDPLNSAAGSESKRPLIVMIFSRDQADAYGRSGTVASIQRAAAQAGTRIDIRRHSVFENPTWLRFFSAGAHLLLSLGNLKPLPLQCTIFADAPEMKRVLSEVKVLAPDVIYLDTIRLSTILPPLRAALPDARIVFDMDDLMSRRFALMAHNRLPLSLGYLQKFIPTALTWLLETRMLGKLQQNYEAICLQRQEELVSTMSDAVVLVSSKDAECFMGSLADTNAVERIIVIPPPAIIQATVITVELPVHFIFIGSDRQIQNRLTIDALLQLWRDHSPVAELMIIGRQQRQVFDVQGVRWLGFVDNLEEVFDASSVLLAPSFLGGGVKTKILEAFGYARPVAGNTTAFEGVDLPNYPLCLDEAGLVDLVLRPEAYYDQLMIAARQGFALVRDHLAAPYHETRWEKVFAGELDATLYK